MIHIKGLSALSAATALLFWVSFLMNRSHPSAAPTMILIAGLQSMAVFSALLWAFSKPNTVFFSIFVGDALLRLAVLGLAVYVLASRHMAYTAPLLSLGAAYFFLSLVQIPFFCRVV